MTKQVTHPIKQWGIRFDATDSLIKDMGEDYVWNKLQDMITEQLTEKGRLILSLEYEKNHNHVLSGTDFYLMAECVYVGRKSIFSENFKGSWDKYQDFIKQPLTYRR